jgi:hypothetical protein
MRSVADDLRAESRKKVAGLDVLQRIELALRLGDEDISTLAVSRGITREEAKRVFARAKSVGRVPSRSNDPDGA